jgi:hypothetical protein
MEEPAKRRLQPRRPQRTQEKPRGGGARLGHSRILSRRSTRPSPGCTRQPQTRWLPDPGLAAGLTVGLTAMVLVIPPPLVRSGPSARPHAAVSPMRPRLRASPSRAAPGHAPCPRESGCCARARARSPGRSRCRPAGVSAVDDHVVRLHPGRQALDRGVGDVACRNHVPRRPVPGQLGHQVLQRGRTDGSLFSTASTAPGLTSNTMHLCPTCTRRRTMFAPMRPSPTIPRALGRDS